MSIFREKTIILRSAFCTVQKYFFKTLPKISSQEIFAIKI